MVRRIAHGDMPVSERGWERRVEKITYSDVDSEGVVIRTDDSFAADVDEIGVSRWSTL